MRVLLFFIIVLVMISSAGYAQRLNYLGVENKISGLTTTSALTITFGFPNDNTFVFPVFSQITEFEFNSTFDANCTVETRSYGNDIVCDVSDLSPTNRSLQIQFDSSNLVTTQGRQSTFYQDFFMPLDIDSLFFQVVLPEGNILTNQTAYMPEDGKTNSDGRRIFIYWNRVNITRGDKFSPQVIYELPLIPTSGLLLQRNTLLGIGLVVAVGASIFFMWRRSNPPKASAPSVQMVLPILKEDEKIVFESVMKHGSGVNQKTIVRESNYSKAKVSKVLKNLQERGILRLERLGRSNKVHINENYTNKTENNSGNN